MASADGGLFLLTPLREGRPSPAPAPRRSRTSFLLTPLREGRHSPRTSKNSTATYFYSRPCGRGDPLPGLYCENTLISSHAPAGGATICAIVVRDSLPAFLLTPLREGRHKFHPFPVRLFRISTHAPAGGATGTGKEALTSEGNFYSRPCGRGDGSMIPGRNACL